jgi:heme/copper-type cytochrome/quinol oxidase subunit 2
MKKFLKIGIVLVFIVMFVFTNIYAFSINDLNGEGSTTGNLKTTGNKTITILSVIGSLISVIVLIVLGIKYTEEKAEYKKSMLPYVIGAVFVFASSAIAGAIYNIIPK